MDRLSTKRLELIPANMELVRAALESSKELEKKLGFRVPESWPPQFLDNAALEFTLKRLQEAPEEFGWWMYFVVLRDEASLVGTCGFKGPPASDDTVELGYGIVTEYQRRGFATETVHGLLQHAFSFPNISRVTAETLPELIPSIGVLRKCGFQLIGDGSEPGVIRFELKGPN